MYYPFTEALKLFLGRSCRWGEQPVPVVFAGPDRAFQEMERIMKRRAQGKKSRAVGSDGLTRQGAADRKAWVPFLSVLVQPFSFDPSRFNPRSFRGITKDIQKGTATTMRFPRPVVADVQVDLWAGAAGGWQIASAVAAQIELQFTAESAYLTIDWSNPQYYKPPFNVLEHAKSYGTTGFRLVNQGWQDTSDLEAGDGPKSVRWTWSARIEGYLPYRLDEARIVRTVPVDIVDENEPEVVLDTIVGGTED